MVRKNDNLAISAMWFAGFNTFQPLNICRGGSELLLKRFGFSTEKTGMFVGETNASINYLVFWGTLFALFLASLDRMIGTKWAEKIPAVLSIISSVIIIIVNCIILHIYRNCQGNDGLRKMYYWLSMAGLAYSIDMTVTRKVTPDKTAEWSFGENFADIFVAMLHSTIRFIMKCVSVKAVNRDYYLLLGHISTVLFLSIFTLIIWLVHLSINVFTPGDVASELGDSLKWLLKLSNSTGSSSQAQPGQKSWNTYLGMGAEQHASNFKTYFEKLKRLNTKLKDMEFTTDVVESECFSGGSLILSESCYQLLNNLERVTGNAGKMQKAISGISASNVTVNVIVENGANGKTGECSGVGTLDITNRSQVTVSNLTCAINGGGTPSNGPLANETINLKTLPNSTMVVKCDSKTLNVCVSRVSGTISCNSLKQLTINSLAGTTTDDTSSFDEFKSIEINNLQGTKDSSTVTNMNVGIKLECNTPVKKKDDKGDNADGDITFELKSGTSEAGGVTLSGLATSNCITVKGTIKKECSICRVGGKRIRVRLTNLSNGFYTRFFSLGAFGIPPEETVKVVDCKLTLDTKTSTATLKLTVPKVTISNCTVNTKDNKPNGSIKVKEIKLIDCDQRKHYNTLRDALKQQFPDKREKVRNGLKDEGVTAEIANASCKSNDGNKTHTITIRTDLTKVCLYNVMQLKAKLSEATDKQSRGDRVTDFVQTVAPAAKKGFSVCMKRCSSPALMLIIGTVILYFIYPVIAPYLMVSQRHRYITSLVMLCCSSLGSITPWILSLKQLRKYTRYKRYWIGKSSAYNYVWILMIPACIIFCSFLICLHYPGGILSRTVRLKWPATVMCCTYHFGLYSIRRIGSGAMYANSSGTAVEDKLRKSDEPEDIYVYVADAINGRDAYTLLIVIRYVLMVMMILYGQSYAVYYRSYTTGEMSSLPWPTRNMNAIKGFIWWGKLAGRKAYARFWDIRQTDIAAVIS